MPTCMAAICTHRATSPCFIHGPVCSLPMACQELLSWFESTWGCSKARSMQEPFCDVKLNWKYKDQKPSEGKAISVLHQKALWHYCTVCINASLNCSCVIEKQSCKKKGMVELPVLESLPYRGAKWSWNHIPMLLRRLLLITVSESHVM